MPVDPAPVLLENDIVEVILRGELCAQTIMTVMHYRFDTVTSPALDELYPDLIEAVQGVMNIGGKYVNAACGNWSGQEVSAQAIYPTRFVKYAKIWDVVGSMPTDALTADLAAVLTRQSWFAMDRTTPDMRGKFCTLHFAPVPNDKMEEGIVKDEYITGELDSLKLALDEPITTAIGNIFVPVVYHRKGAAPHYTDIVLSDWHREVRVMRRRTVGRGI